MTIGFILPAIEVLKDQVVIAGEVSWYTQELTGVVISSIIIASMLVMLDEVLGW